MPTRFLIAKYAPDLRRMEPRNIGVVVWSDGQAACKFVGEEHGIPRSLGIRDKRNFHDWTSSWRRMLEKEAIEDERGRPVPKDSEDYLEVFRGWGHDNYMLVDGGEIFEKPPIGRVAPTEIAQALYAELVAVGSEGEEKVRGEASLLHKRAAEAMKLAGVRSRKDISIRQDVLYKPFGITGYFQGDYILGPTRRPFALFQEVVLGDRKAFDSSIHRIYWFLQSNDYEKERCGALIISAAQQTREYQQHIRALRQVAKVISLDDEEIAIPAIKETASLTGHSN